MIVILDSTKRNYSTITSEILTMMIINFEPLARNSDIASETLLLKEFWPY